MRRRLFIALIIFAAVLIVGLVSVLSALNTPSGQKFVAEKIAQSLSTPDTQVEMSGVSGSIFDAIQIAAVRVSDDAGVWLSIADIDIAWKPWALLGGQFHVSRLNVGSVIFERLPQASTSAATRPTGVPQLPITITIREIALPSIILGELVLGERMAFGLSGHVASDRGEGLSTVLQLVTLEGEGTTLSLDAKLDSKRKNLSLKLDMNESQSGLIGRLLNIANAPDMTLSVSGDGPLSAWLGTFEFIMGSVGTAPDALVTGTLSANVMDASHLRLTGQAEVAKVFPSPLNFDVSTHLDVNSWSAHIDDLSLRAHGWNIGGTAAVQLENLDLDGHFEGDVTQALVLANDMTLDAGHVEVDLLGLATAPEVTIKGILQDPYAAGFSAHAVDFRAHLATSLADKVTPFEMHAVFKAPRTEISTLAPWFGEELEAAGVLLLGDGEAWHLDAFTLKSGTAVLKGDALFTLPTGRIEGDFTGEVESLSPLGTTLGMFAEGRAQLDGNVSGLLADPDITMTVKVTTPESGPVQGGLAEINIQAHMLVSAPTGQVDGRMEFDGAMLTANSAFALRPGHDLRFDNLRLEAGGGTAQGQLVWMFPQGVATGSLKVESLNLHPLGRMVGIDLSGTVDGVLGLDHDQGKQRINGQFTAKKLNVPEHRFQIARLDLQISARQNTDALTFDSTARLSKIVTPYAALDTADVHLQGTPSRADLTLKAQGLVKDVERLSLKARIMHTDDTWTADISAFDGRISSVAIALKEPARLSYAPARVSIECLILAVGDGKARACFESTSHQVDGSVMLSQLPLSTFAPWVPVDMDWPKTPQGGMVGLDLTLRGASQEPDLSFSLRVDDVRLSAKDDILEPMNLKATGDFTNGQLTTNAYLSGPGDMRGDIMVRVPGTLSLSPFLVEINERSPFEAELHLDGALDGVQRFLPLDPHQIFGVVKAQIAVRGHLSAPQWNGTVRLDQGRYENLKTGTVLKDIEADLQGSGNTLSLHTLRANDGENGSLVGHGKILMTSIQNPTLDIVLSLKDMYVMRRDDITAIASGNLDITGEAKVPHVAGELTLSPVEIRIPDTLPVEVVELPISKVIGTPITSASGSIESPNLSAQQTGGLRVDMIVNVPGRMFLRGRGLTSEWAGRFKVQQHAALLQIDGALRPVRGEYQFAGKVFRLTEGSVTFTNREIPEPTLDLSAEYGRGDFKAIIRIGGTASAPKITLLSIPELPQDEILSRVLFGRKTGQLSALEAVQLAEAVGQLSGTRSFGGGGLNALRKAIGTDVLRFEGGESDQGPSATVGKYVADDIYVGAKQGTTPKSSGATVEIELTPNISLDSEVHQDSSTHFGIKWKWDY